LINQKLAVIFKLIKAEIARFKCIF